MRTQPTFRTGDRLSPMILLKACDIVRQFDAAPVLDGVSFEVRAGERIGLVGPNGAGKSTLFHILCGRDEADEGGVELGGGARVDLLEQDPEFSPDRTLLEEARAGLAPLYALQDEFQHLAEQIAHATDPAQHERLQKRYDLVHHELDRLNAYSIDHRVDEVLAGLGFRPEQYGQPMRSLSGGQQNRVALARLLLAAPDVLLLDEPTNHLDIAATEWLEKYLIDTDQALIAVSHDRYFLDRVTTRTLELFQGVTVDYPGNFSKYWELKDERNKVLQRTFEKQQEFIEKTEEFIRRNFYGQKATQAKDREKKLERLERVDRPREIPVPTMQFGQPRRAGDWVVDAVKLAKGFGRAPLFSDVTLRIQRGDRVGIFGPNGAGKTTLLRTLLGEIPADAGTVRFGTNVDLAYFDQQLTSVDPALDLVDAIRPPGNPQVTPAQLRDLLARFGLRGDIVHQRVGSLSGGEKSKVALARLASQNANLLILDEPTNHLDLWACAALEQALQQFEGTVLFVSHDRYFLDRVATSLIVFEPGRWRLFPGTYSTYLDQLKRAAETLDADKSAPANSGAAKSAGGPDKGKGAAKKADDKPAKRKRKYPYRKLEDIETDITATEIRLGELQVDLGNPDIYRDPERAREIQDEYEEMEARLAQLLEHWEESMELN